MNFVCIDKKVKSEADVTLMIGYHYKMNNLSILYII